MRTPAWLKDWRVRRKIRQFQRAGSWPWARGYGEYKEQKIGQILKSGCFDPEFLQPNFGYGLD